MRKLYGILLLCLPFTVPAEIQFVNGSSDGAYLLVQRNIGQGFADVVTLAPGQSFRFQPWDGYTNGVFNIVVENSNGGTVGTNNLTVYDGDVVSLGFADNVEQHSGLLDNATARDQAWCDYFTKGLESGSGLAAILLGFIAVRRALQMGEQWD